MNVIYASEGNYLYAFDFDNNLFYGDYTYKRLLWRMSDATTKRNLDAFIKSQVITGNRTLTICKGPYNKRNLKKHIELCYPEYLL
jgi:hypothetical protein